MPDEKFDWKKFINGFNLINPVNFAKVARDIFYTLVILAIIIGGIYGYGYWKGKKSQPIVINNMEDRTITVKDSNNVEHKIDIIKGAITFDGQKVIVGDLKVKPPFGWQLRPGIAVVTRQHLDICTALSLAYVNKFEVDVLGNKDFIGGGISYKITTTKPFQISNTSLGAGLLFDFQTLERSYLLYAKVSF